MYHTINTEDDDLQWRMAVVVEGDGCGDGGWGLRYDSEKKICLLIFSEHGKFFAVCPQVFVPAEMYHLVLISTDKKILCLVQRDFIFTQGNIH